MFDPVKMEKSGWFFNFQGDLIGPKGKNYGSYGTPYKYQSGGSVDNIPAMLTGGEFVVNAGAVKKYGSNTLQYMNRGGMIGDQKFVPGDQNGSSKKSQAESSTNNNTVNISVNMGNGGGLPTVSEDASGTAPNTANGGRELGRKIRDAVLHVIDQEKRIGGKLRNPYAREQ
jgi:hypothetical protein